jgi:uncharacterized iron-regulated protein
MNARSILLPACRALVCLPFFSMLPTVGAHPQAQGGCVPVGAWAQPGPSGARVVDAGQLHAGLARRRVVLLGEGHDIPEHHRWQLQTIAALYAHHPRLVLGFEMFPRSVQPVLDRWVAGELTEAQLLRESDWRSIWGFDPQMYLPIFHFARMNRIPMQALNVSREFTRAVSERGFDAIPAREREGVTRPAKPLREYEDFLLESFAKHGAGQEAADPAAMRADPRFRRFLESQLVWDRAMAERIVAALDRHPDALVVALMGTGHLMNGWGVPHQLRALGLRDPAVLLPWESEDDCAGLRPSYADAVFGLGGRSDKRRARPRLGIWLEPAPDGVLVRDLDQTGIGALAGLRSGDIVVEAAGVPSREASDLSDTVQRQAPGTWLPLKVKRDGQLIELIAKFPPEQP